MASQSYRPVSSGQADDHEIFEMSEHQYLASSISTTTPTAYSAESVERALSSDTCEVEEQLNRASLRLTSTPLSDSARPRVEGVDDGHDQVPKERSLQPSSPPYVKMKLLRKLSPLTSATLLLSFFAILATVAYLCFLWSNPHGTKRSRTWLNIVLSGRALISITISAVILRTAVSAHAM
jgi:hypothetical protein